MKPWTDLIADGRGALAWGEGARGRLPGAPAAELLALLWHEEREVRQAAVRALPGGDREHDYSTHYGYFAEAFLRELTARRSQKPAQPEESYRVVAAVLSDLIGRSTRDIRAMSGMHYSFLSSALYLALFATCRDALLAAMRLRSGEVHEALCDLLWNLSAVAGVGRLNPQDTLLLMNSAGQALAAMPPDEIPAFWAALSHPHATRRNAVSPALPHLSDRRAVPYLLEALPLQKPDVAERVIVALGRLADVSALPLLAEFGRNANRVLSRAAKAAAAAILRAQQQHPVQTLLRPAAPDPRELLRSVGTREAMETDTLLHPMTDPKEDEGLSCE